MKRGRVKGGSIIPATIDTGRRFRSNMAQPIRNMAGSPRGTQGGAAQNIIEITSDDLVQNGGQYKLMGGTPLPMQIVTGRRSKQGAATVVYPVDALGNYDPSFAGYIYKLRQIESDNLVGLWAQNELAGGVSIDYSGHGYDGAYTAVTLGQAGVPGSGMSSAGYDGLTSFNNIYSAGLANDNGLANPGFEAPGAGPPVWLNWVDTLGDGALANEVVIVHEGTDAAKITSGPLSDTSIYGAVVVIPGQRRRLRFWSQGDGADAGRYIIWDATNGANIQAMTSTGIAAAAWGMVAVEYTVPAGCVLVHHFLACPNVNGGIAYFDACEDRRMDGFLGDQGTVIVPVRVAAGAWTDGLQGTIIRFAVDGENFIMVQKAAAANRIDFFYEAGNVQESQAVAGLVYTNFFSVGITWDILAGANGEVRYYIQGIQNGATDTGLGTWVGDLVNTDCVIGARTIFVAQAWSGNESILGLWNTALTPAQMADASVL